jgi:hypothetical protein
MKLSSHKLYLLATVACLSIFWNTVAIGKDFKFDHDRVSLNVTGCTIETALTFEGRKDVTRGPIGDLHCTFGDWHVECSTQNGQNSLETTISRDGNITEVYAHHSLIAVYESAPLEKKRALLNQLNATASSCVGKASFAAKERHPPGSTIEVKVWGGGNYGFTGQVIEATKPNAEYRVKITDIYTSSHLNPSHCSEERFLEKYKDEGRLLVIPEMCIKK